MRSKARLAVSLAAVSFFIGASPARSQAQDATRTKTEAPPQAEAPPHSYRLEYTLTETEGGKKIDSRQYTITTGGGTNSGRPWQGHVNIGTRIPIGLKGDSDYQYVDIGARITSFISMRDGAQVLDTHFDFSSVAPDETKIEGHPILRTIGMESETPILMEGLMTVGTADDPNSGRKFTLDVTVKEIK